MSRRLVGVNRFLDTNYKLSVLNKTRNVATGHGCPHFSSFVTKRLKFSLLMDGQSDKCKSNCHPLVGPGA